MLNDELKDVNPGQAVVLHSGETMECCTNMPRDEKMIIISPTCFNDSRIIAYELIKEIIPEKRLKARWSDGSPYNK